MVSNAIDLLKVKYPYLSLQTIQIIHQSNSPTAYYQVYPNSFHHNIGWIQDGKITEQEFLTTYNYLVEQGEMIPFEAGKLSNAYLTQKKSSRRI